jgi:hypothetical protein
MSRHIGLCVALTALLLADCRSTIPQSGQAAGIRIAKETQRAAVAGFSVALPDGHEWTRLTAEQVRQTDLAYKLGFSKGMGSASEAMAVVGAYVTPEANPEDVLQPVTESRAAKETGQSSRGVQVLSYRSRFIRRDGTTCWRVDEVAEDRGVPGHQEEAFTLRRCNLTCSHPDFPAYLVIADYRLRVKAGEPSPNPDEEAESFLNGLAFDRIGKRITTISLGSECRASRRRPALSG